MSYARFSEASSVYVYRDWDGLWNCCGCILADDSETVRFKNLYDLKEHLIKHQKEGGNVPNYCFDRIDEEIAEAKQRLGMEK